MIRKSKVKNQKLKSRIRIQNFAFWIVILLFDIWILNFSACLGCAFNNQETNVFKSANTCYEQADYDEAIKQYNSILEGGWESGGLYYNLGNCFFKKGKLGQAVLNYERAKRFLPRDKDLEANYEYAKSFLKDSAFNSEKNWALRVLSKFSSQFSLDGLTLFLSFFYISFFCALTAGMVFKIKKRHLVIFAGAWLIVFAMGILSFEGKITALDKEAVIIKEMEEVRFAPFEKATIYFTLYEGMKIYIISSEDGWCKVKRLDGKTGWIKRESLEVI